MRPISLFPSESETPAKLHNGSFLAMATPVWLENLVSTRAPHWIENAVLLTRRCSDFYSFQLSRHQISYALCLKCSCVFFVWFECIFLISAVSIAAALSLDNFGKLPICGMFFREHYTGWAKKNRRTSTRNNSSCVQLHGDSRTTS